MASSSSASPSAPALSSKWWKYGVFLSFRGEDTRNTFVGHLYSALEQEGIYTYKDDETLPRGESIRPSLMKAIEESQISVIVFSKNYCDSSWCLDELAYIMKCRDTRSQIVMPIFYDVDPSEVRKQKRKYAEAFAKHELENKTKVESWRKALVDASNISGWEPKHIANGDELKGIKQIVGEISHKLHLVTSSADENLIGMEARLQDVAQECVDEEREDVVDTNYEEVVDNVHNYGETDETGHIDDNGHPHFFKKDNEADCEMSDNVGAVEPVNGDTGENEDDEADVDTNLPNIFNEEQPWKLLMKGHNKTTCPQVKRPPKTNGRKLESVKQTQGSVNMERDGEDVEMGDVDREDVEMDDVGG
ncbi:unnamed protein product [Lactuca virosa]|uniref:TIR domain-containing protein n=1 Tax=Lactuca virosa TaxID=75947 RepID=A0AAU9MYH1_9ASTR|nr:unnamed protein product [Lactuca virosa]